MVKRIVFWVLVLAVAGGAHAQMWMGEYSSAWSDDRNWLGGEPTFGGKSVLVGKVTDPNRHEPVITEFGELTSGRFFLNGRLFIESGDLTCFSRFYIGYARSGPGELTMTGGRMDIIADTADPSRLSIGDESPGTVNLYDGEINVYTSIAWPDGSAPGLLNLYGGVISTQKIGWKDRPGWGMVFHSSAKYPHGGKLILNGDKTQPQECDNVCGSMEKRYQIGGITTTVPGDVVRIAYYEDLDVTIIESIPREQLPTPCGLDPDGSVDWHDIEVFAENWLRPGGDNPADFDGHAGVNLRDFAILAAQWQKSCP